LCRPLRKVGLAIPVESTIDPQAIREIVKVVEEMKARNADLARLGNLINQWRAGTSDFKTQTELESIRAQISRNLSEARIIQDKLGDLADKL
jgi:hypothetical protein